MPKINHLTLTIITCLLLFFVISVSVSALGIGDTTNNIKTTANVVGYGETTITDIIAAVIQAVLGLVGIIFFIMIIYGGVTWMTAAGNPEKIGKAKKLIINAIIGLAIVTAAYSISYFVASALEAKPQ